MTALRVFEVLDTAAKIEFDALARAAALVCGVPIAMLSLVDAECQWFKANVGLPGAVETPRDVAFCAHAVLGNTVLEVSGATGEQSVGVGQVGAAVHDLDRSAQQNAALVEQTAAATSVLTDQARRLTGEAAIFPSAHAGRTKRPLVPGRHR
jgi:hypothetical protein